MTTVDEQSGQHERMAGERLTEQARAAEPELDAESAPDPCAVAARRGSSPERGCRAPDSARGGLPSRQETRSEHWHFP